MSLFRLVKYSSILFFLGKYKYKLFRGLAVLLFAGVTALIYDDVEVFLAREHPGALVYALIAKICIVYGALLFVLLQFRPVPDVGHREDKYANRSLADVADTNSAADRLAQLSNLDSHDQLQSRAETLLKKR